MTDAQLTAVIAALSLGGGAFVTFLKWAFGQWMADRKEEREERKQERAAQTAATIEVAKVLATVSVKIDTFERKLDSLGANVEHVADEVTGNHRIPKPRARTSPGEYGPRKPPREDG